MDNAQKVEIENLAEIDTVCEDYHQCHNLDLTTSYSDFFHNYMVKNKPCLINNVSSEWNCTKNWVINDKINIDYFKEAYGNLTAPVANCNEMKFGEQTKTEMNIHEYMDYLQNENNRENLLYLKDWHLRRLKPDDRFYQVPIFFSSDWLNEFALDRKDDDFMFVYIGPKESWTPIHADVYYSYSWSVNIVGRKKWILFPPGEETKLKDHFGQLPSLFDPAKESTVNYIELIQERGDAIFVPSGWHHQVINMIDTISINHNWVNACNIEKVWTELQNSLVSVENEIRELYNSAEYDSECQMILKSLFGMDFAGFVELVDHICKKRLLESNGQTQLYFNKFNLGKNHTIFDLKSLKNIIYFVMNHPQFKKEYMPPQLKHDILNHLKCFPSTL